MRQANNPSGRLRFGVFEVDLRAGELTKRGLRIRLQEQPFQVLAMLLAQPGQLVTREELQKKLWSQTVVDFDHGLNKAINKIREALGDSAENPRFVETVARRGYRFLADVEAIDTASRQPETSPYVVGGAGPFDGGQPGAARKRLPHSIAWRLFGFGLALVLAVALFGILHPWNYPSSQIRSL